jgi:stearoyl-CoA desaturase (delta-9 desaturase)
VIANRYDVLKRYTSSLKHTYAAEMERLGHWSHEAKALKSIRRALTRVQRLSAAEKARLTEAAKGSTALSVALSMRDELVAIWDRSTASKEQLVQQLEDWCRRAEASGVAPLADFSRRLRCYA